MAIAARNTSPAQARHAAGAAAARDEGRREGDDAGELALLAEHATRDWRPVIATADLPVLFVAGHDSEFWPASHASACVALAPIGDSIVLADDGHAANIEQPKAFNEALLGFLRAG